MPARKRRPERASASRRSAISRRVQLNGLPVFDGAGLAHFCGVPPASLA